MPYAPISAISVRPGSTTSEVSRESRVRPVRDALSALDHETVSVGDEDGRAMVDLADAPRPCGDLEVPVRLLPKFDSLTLAYAPANRKRTLPSPTTTP